MKKCKHCDGTGMVIGDPCPVCYGYGIVEVPKLEKLIKKLLRKKKKKRQK